MKALFWNCRGLGRPATQQHLMNQISNHSPDLVLLSETLASEKMAKRVAKKAKFPNYFVQPSVGRKEGFLLLWLNNISLTICFVTNWLIEMQISFEGKTYQAIFLHASSLLVQQRQQWALIEKLCNSFNGPSLIFGDFNAMLSNAEKRGGAPLNLSQTEAFLQFIQNCNLCELPLKGPQFTWTNGQYGFHRISERLDRGFVTTSFFDLFPNPILFSHAIIASDHSTMLLDLNHENRLRRRPFRFEAFWLQEDTYHGFLEKIWSQLNPSMPVSRKLQLLAFELKKWNKNEVGNIHNKLNHLKDQIQAVQEAISHSGNHQLSLTERTLQNEYAKLLSQQEVFWYQKSRVKWLTCGDQNTKFFHKSTIIRRHRNFIHSLKTSDNVEITDRKQLQNHIINYFESVFRAQAPWTDMHLPGLISKQISDLNNTIIGQVPSAEEVWSVVKNFSPYKAPGPDGFSAIFYQRSWETIGNDVVSTVQNFFETGELPERINHTFIVLIPKVDNPRSLSQFRPISLCNVLYKIIAKILVLRLRPLLPNLIAPNQSAFVPGRLIRDNILIHHEVIHSFMKGKKRPKKAKKKKRRTHQRGLFALKLDFAKAYDRVNWDFLRSVLIAYGFNLHVTNLIMKCVQSTSYSILFNGTPVGEICATRGLRQGDPLSPYLFILCQQVLTLAISRLELDGRYTGIRIKRQSPSLTHLMYADDIIVYGHNCPREAHALVRLLHRYCCESGQEINLSKSSIFFSKSTTHEQRIAMKSLFNIHEGNKVDKYLGLPVIHKKPSSRDCRDLIARLTNRLASWKATLLSQMGRTVLIQSVLSAMPLHFMQCYLLPISTLNRLDQLARGFFWQNSPNKQLVPTICWDRITTSWREGGLNIKKANLMNRALLLKAAWQLHTNHSSLWSKLMQSVYFPDASFMDAVARPSHSYVWRQLQKLKDFISQGCRWMIATGDRVDLFRHRWLGNGDLLPQPDDNSGHAISRVSDIIDPISGNWNLNIIISLWPPSIVSEITATPITPSLNLDKAVWRLTSTGRFSVSSAYRMLNQNSFSDDGLWLKVWHIHSPPRFKLFLWKSIHRVIPSANLLSSRIPMISDVCCFCKSKGETVEHIWLHCPFSRAVWLATIGGSIQDATPQRQFNQWFRNVVKVISRSFRERADETLTKVVIFGWVIWMHRNGVLFNHAKPSVFQVIRHFNNLTSEILSLCQAKTEFFPGSQQIPVQWIAPSYLMVKINFDGSYRKGTLMSGIGVIARNYEGRFIAAVASRCYVDSPLQAEAIAVLEAIRMAYAMDFRNILLEGDSLSLIKLLIDWRQGTKNEDDIPWKILPYLTEIKALWDKFQSFHIQHTYREGNMAADFLANFSIDVYSCVWTKRPPKELCGILADEARNFVYYRSVK